MQFKNSFIRVLYNNVMLFVNKNLWNPPYIAEWGWEDDVHWEDGWEHGDWMGSPLVGALELQPIGSLSFWFQCYITVASIYLLPIILYISPPPDYGTCYLYLNYIHSVEFFWEIFEGSFLCIHCWGGVVLYWIGS
jgi:hypothetical protein